MLSELIVKFFHGDFTPQGFKRYSGLWKGPPPGNIGKKEGDSQQQLRVYRVMLCSGRTLPWASPS